MTDNDRREFTAYVDTLDRLQATIRDARREGNEATEEEARRAINRMREHVKARRGEAGWAAVEQGIAERESAVRAEKYVTYQM